MVPPAAGRPGRSCRYPLTCPGGQDGCRDTRRDDRGCHKTLGTGVLCAAGSRANRQEPAMSESGRMDSATEEFVAHRNLLFTVAYEMLGSAADAEDVLQETWLRWADVDLDTVRDRRAYLVRITTRQALSRLRTLRRRRASYVGPWLLEPLLTAPDVAEDVELSDSVSMAMLLVLETLTPTERAVFVLREVLDRKSVVE